jgi:lysine N6-hydroxylase
MTNLVKDNQLYDLAGIGIGPFNLGLAALLKPIEKVRSIFFEQNSQFNWHPGILLNNAKLQVPFLADMVTFADPTSPYSFLNYLKEHNRLYKFYFYENFFVLRKEYNHYCQWVSKQLNTLQFDTTVLDIKYENLENIGMVYRIEARNLDKTNIFYARHIALGVGTSKYIPDSIIKPDTPYIFHSSQFVTSKKYLDKAKSVCVIGSGQSAGEIVLELLNQQPNLKRKLNWITQSKGIFPMEYSKLGLEHFSPDYMNFFYHLNYDTRKKLINDQDMMYKGVSKQTISDIFDALYQLTVANKEQPLTITANTRLDSILEASSTANKFNLNLTNILTNSVSNINCDVVILATGYKSADMTILKSLKNILAKDHLQTYMLNADFSIQNKIEGMGKIFMQNNSLYSHGVGSPDLGLGCYRNCVIVNSILGENFYPTLPQNVFQNFSLSCE